MNLKCDYCKSSLFKIRILFTPHNTKEKKKSSTTFSAALPTAPSPSHVWDDPLYMD